MKMNLTFCTRYNGIYITPDDDDVEVTDAMQGAFDNVADTLPSMTYDMCKPWDYVLTAKQIAELIFAAKLLIADVIPDAEISFEYDHVSS